MTCPYRKDLPERDRRIAALPLDDRGYPVPFFVATIDGKPDFRVIDPEKWVACHKKKLCWVCGQGLGSKLAFVVGPMCTINRTTAEPPMHRSCAEYSTRACPFLSKPQMVRREDEVTEDRSGNVSGHMVKRNPGVICLWMTKTYRLFQDAHGKPLIRMGEPFDVTWWKEGRPATREEVLVPFRSGMEILKSMCVDAGDSKALEQHYELARQFLPK